MFLTNSFRFRSFTYVGRVVCGPKDEFRSPVVTRADVGNVGLPLDEVLGASKIAQLQHSRLGVKQQVLWLDVPVADAQRVDVGQASKQLVHVELDETDRDCLF